MIVVITCSLIVKGPGLSFTPKSDTLGIKRAQAFPIGKDKSKGMACPQSIPVQLSLGVTVRKRWWNTNRSDSHGGVSKVEELVDAGNNDSPDDADKPGAQSGRRHRGIIRVGHSRPDFWVRGLIFKYKCCWVEVWIFIVGGPLRY